MPGPGLLSDSSPNVSQACVHTPCRLWYTELCFSTHWSWLNLTLIYFSLALGTLSMGHLFLASTTCWVGLGIHTGATSCFTSNSQLSPLLCLVYYEWYYVHPTGVDLLVPALFRTKSLQKKPSWHDHNMQLLDTSFLCSECEFSLFSATAVFYNGPWNKIIPEYFQYFSNAYSEKQCILQVSSAG